MWNENVSINPMTSDLLQINEYFNADHIVMPVTVVHRKLYITIHLLRDS